MIHMVKESRFIIIDDDALSAKISQMIIKLATPSADIKIYTSPINALSSLQDDSGQFQHPTIILLDLYMSEMSAWDFIEALKNKHENFSNRYIIYILTASIQAKDKARSSDTPHVESYIEKPLTAEKVRLIIDATN